MRVLFLIPHSKEGASSRYRVLQYLPYLESNGIQCTVSSFLFPAFYRVAYQRGHWFKKGTYFLISSLKRLGDMIRSQNYDLIFIHLEAFPIGPPLIEWFLSLRNIPIVYDLDDALFLPRRYTINPVVELFRMPRKIGMILKKSHYVITCNDYLKEYVLQYNSKVSVIPTCVDTQKFCIAPREVRHSKPVIGWVGSHTTAPYLEILRPVFLELSKRYSFVLKIVGGLCPFQIPGVEIIEEPWFLEKDASYFQELDIGVYPLPNEPWVLGKTGFKTIQYMSVGVPSVVSDVGSNREIVCDGVNGFVASSIQDWVEKLGKLLKEPELRNQLGMAGRKTVEERFSTNVHAFSYLNIFNESVRKNRF